MSKTTSSLSTPMARVRGLGAAKSGTGHFWLTRLTAVANVPLTIAFVVIVLMLAKADYAAAMKIVGHPVAGILLLLFVGSATVHMRLGMQVIIEDYIHGEGAKVLAVMANTFFAIAVGAASVYAVLKLSFGG